MPRFVRPLALLRAAAIVAMLLTCATWVHGAETPAAPRMTPQRAPRKTLLMHYMPWYQTPQVRGKWGSHWTGHESQHHPDQKGADGLPDIWSHYHPLIGLYDSTDPAVLECHLLQMRLAGVDGVIVDWYGIANAADYPPIHDATKAMFEATGRFGMTFSVCFEDRTVEFQVKHGLLKPEDVPGHLSTTFQWMQAEWFPHPQYFRIDGRPLVLNFGPIYVSDPAAWSAAVGKLNDRPEWYALHHLWRKAGADGGFSWVHPDAWAGNPDSATIQRKLMDTYLSMNSDPAKLIPSAIPGYNDVYTESHAKLPHRNGATLRESLNVAMQGPWPVVQLVTWNDYGEGTMIEPTHEFGYLFLEIIQEQRRAELGAAFTIKPADLRLPARLYKLRKENQASSADLDRVSDLLRKGKCDEAGGQLERMARQ